ncbi:MAG TPA: hypothetical protein VIV54_10670 [Burkholderiales bacterium]
MRRMIKGLAGGLLLAVTASAWAFDIKQLETLGQQEFRTLSEDLGGALSYHPQTPTEPLGITGFDVGLALTAAHVRNTEVFNRVSGESIPSYLPIPTLRLDKGLPLGFDVGALYAMIPGSDIKFWGVQGRYAILKGGIAEPAVGVRASYTRLTGVDQLDLNTKGLDISASKGFLMLTPYAGVGRVWVSSEPHAGGLAKEDFGLNKVFIGAGFKLLLFNMNAELDRTGPDTALSLKAGIRF